MKSVGNTLFVDLGIDATNDDIIDQMRIAKAARQQRTYENVVCGIRGFGNDPRELYEIPEVRAFCRRITTLGFISYLNVTTKLGMLLDGSWGAFEVWLCGEGRLKRDVMVTPELWREFQNELSASNVRADAAVGPFSEDSQ